MTGSTAPTAALVLGPGEGEEIAAAGNRLVMRAASPRVTVIDYVAPPGFPGPPLHVHPGFDEVFHVMEGTLSMRIGDEVHEIAPGGTAYVDGATPHTFANPADAPLRFLVVLAPGGFEDYFRGLAAGDQQLVAETSSRFGYAGWPGG